MPRPSGLAVEIAFTTGVWTDVTADLDYNQTSTIKVGRNSPTGTPDVSELTLVLRNTLGRYTPGVQVLTDGTTNPLYPNVRGQVPIRVRTAAGVRFVGRIRAWQPQLVNGVANYVTVTARDRTNGLSRVTMLAPLAQELLPDAPRYYWPLTDDGDDGTATEHSGGPTLKPFGYATPVPQFGQDGPGSANGTSVLFTPAQPSVTSGQLLAAPGLTLAPAAGFSVELWVKFTSRAYTSTILDLDNRVTQGSPGSYSLVINDVAGLTALMAHDIDSGSRTGANASNSGSMPVGVWHHVVVTYDGAGTMILYLNGVAGAPRTGIPGSVLPSLYRQIQVGGYYGEGYTSLGNVAGQIGQVALFPSALSADRVAKHYRAGNGWLNETVDQRVARFLGYGGVPATDLDLDASQVPLSTYDQAGKDLMTAAQEAVTSEGGGAVLYELAGRWVFRDRYFRMPGAPDLVVDAVTDLDRSTPSPGLDTDSLVNSVDVQRATASGTATTVTITDQDSIDDNGLMTGSSVTSFAESDDDARELGEYLVAIGRNPGLRLPQLVVDLLTAGSDLYAQVQATEIGSRVKVKSLPPGTAPADNLTVFVEGWTEAFSVNQYLITYDTSPADSPAFGFYNDPTTARYQCDGQTLHAALTAGQNVLTADQAGPDGSATRVDMFSGAGSVLYNSADLGVGVWKLTAGGSGYVAFGTGVFVPGYRFRVKPGVTYNLSALGRAASTSRSAFLEIVFLDASGNFIANPTSAAAAVPVGSFAAMPTLAAVAPANAVSAYLVVYVQAAASGEVFYFAGLRVDAGSATSTSVVVDSPAGAAAFTTAPSAYPLTIAVGAEHIRLLNPPSGSASPQTFSAAVRAVDGTYAAAQAAAAPVQLSPSTTFAL